MYSLFLLLIQTLFFPLYIMFKYCQKFNIANNQINNVGTGVCSLIHLSKLLLRNNAITVIPENVGSMINLIELDAAYNQIEILPSSIGDLINLKKLNFEKSWTSKVQFLDLNLVGEVWI